MHQLGNEEKAALLLASADDDSHEQVQSSATVRHDDHPVIAKRPKTYQRRNSNGPHPMLCFVFVLFAFILGSITGVVIILYRMSQDSNQLISTNANSAALTKVDLTVQKKLFESITKTNFLNLNHSIELEYESANRIERYWQSLSNVFTRVNKFSYDLTLSKYSPPPQWTGIEILNKKDDQQINKFNVFTKNDYVSYSSLIKSGRVDANYIYYVNYGRQEDFAYLMKQVQFSTENNDKTILFMRRKSTVISQTEQIRQTIHYGFAGLVLFDDSDNDSQSYQQIETTNDRQSFSDEWLRLSTEKARQKFIDGITNEDDRQILVLLLKYDDVEKIFASDSNNWLLCPPQWHSKAISIKLGGSLEQTKLRLTTYMQEEPARLPFVLGYIAGSIDADRFIMVGYQLGRTQQEKVVDEIIKAFESPIKYGWHPRRSIVFCAWSGFSYDRYTIRRWIADNYRFIDRNLVAYIDLGQGVTGNSTINLHGSPLLQQIARHAADSVVSPLVHNHTCHHRHKQPNPPMEHDHHNRRKRDEGHDHHMETSEHEEEPECEPHKLLDEWLRASNNRIGVNKSLSIVQMIDTDSVAALFQLQHGIPSLLIEMTDEPALNNDTFFLRKSPAVFNSEISPEVIAAYAQLVAEIIRQLIDEPLIPFNLTDYANVIEWQTTTYLTRYDKAYQSLRSHLGDPSDMTKVTSDLIKTIRQIQSNIEQMAKDNYVNIQVFNQKLMEFERLFIIDDQLRGMSTADETYKHVFLGPAFGLTNTIVPFPSLSNLLYRIATDPQTELCDASKLYWSRVKQHFQLITRTLNGLNGLL